MFPWVIQLGDAAPFGLGALTIGAFALLLWSNLALRHEDHTDEDGAVKDLVIDVTSSEASATDLQI